jgi:hypothetical protein
MCIGEQGCNIHSCIGELYVWHLLVRYWRVFIGEILEGCWRILCFLVLPICRTDVVSPSKVPKTKQNTPVEDASLPAPRTAWHLKCRLYWICVACNGGAIFFYFHLLAFHECIRASATFLGQKPAEPKGPPRQWPSNV